MSQLSVGRRTGFRGALDGKRVLLLLDNAKDAGVVAPLFEHRPPGCAILVTSRERIVGPGVTPVALEHMTPEEARKLLRAIVGAARASDAQLDEVARHCGCLPLALRLAGTFLLQHTSWPVEVYLKALAGERGRLANLKTLADVAPMLGFSSRQLAEEDRELAERWQTLPVFVESFDLEAVAAVWEVSADEALEGLGELVARSMVRFDPKTSRYRLHDLMRGVAQVPLDKQDASMLEVRLEQARKSHATHYCEVLATADQLYLGGGETIFAGLALYDLEKRNIFAGQAWAVAGIEKDDVAARLAIQYADAGAFILALRLHPREQIHWFDSQLKACARLGDQAKEASALSNLGLAWAALGKPHLAVEYYKQALGMYREVGDRLAEAQDLSNLGNAWAALGERRRAKEYHEQALLIMHEMGDRRGMGNVLGNLGNALADLDEPRSAIGYYEQHLLIAREIGDRRGEGSALGNLGLAFAELGELQRAIELYEQQFNTACEIGDRMGEGSSLFNSALALNQLGERAEAVRRAREALAIYEAIGAKHLVEKVRAKLAEWGVADGGS